MELIKYYNQDGDYVKTLERNHPSSKELWYNIVVGLIVNLKFRKLYLQLDTENNLQLTAGGHVQCDEESNEAIAREILEETGINVGDCELLNTFTYKCYSKNQFHKYYIYNADITLNSFQIKDKKEVLTFIELEIDELLNQAGCIGKDVEGIKKSLNYYEVVKAFNGEYVLYQICNIIKNLPSV